MESIEPLNSFFYEVRVKGSKIYFKGPNKVHRVTIEGLKVCQGGRKNPFGVFFPRRV